MTATNVFRAILMAMSVHLPGMECRAVMPSQDHAYEISFGFGSHSRERRGLSRTGRGVALETWDCDTIISIPSEIVDDLQIDGEFYKFYTHAYGIPIVSSAEISTNQSLTRACYVVRFMLADRKDIRDSLYDQYARVAVIGLTEATTDIPEFGFLGSEWDDRARGLGGLPENPVTTDAEENVLCNPFPQDRWYKEDVLIHEFAHTIHFVALDKINSTFSTALRDTYEAAKDANLWSNTYAISRFSEYFAEGVQGFFDVQTCSSFVDNVHNDICTRDALKNYDRRLYDLIAEVFPCKNQVVDRCEEDQSLATNQVLAMSCDELPTTSEPTTGATTGATTEPTTGATTEPTIGATTGATTEPTKQPTTKPTAEPSLNRTTEDSTGTRTTEESFTTGSGTDDVTTSSDGIFGSTVFATGATTDESMSGINISVSAAVTVVTEVGVTKDIPPSTTEQVTKGTSAAARHVHGKQYTATLILLASYLAVVFSRGSI